MLPDVRTNIFSLTATKRAATCWIQFPYGNEVHHRHDAHHVEWWIGVALRDLRSNVAGGKLSISQINLVEARLKVIEKCTPLEFEGKVRSFSSIHKYKTHEIRRLVTSASLSLM